MSYNVAASEGDNVSAAGGGIYNTGTAYLMDQSAIVGNRAVDGRGSTFYNTGNCGNELYYVLPA